MGIRRETVTVTTDGSQNATAYSNPITGEILQIRYIKADSLNFTDGVDFAIVGKDTLQGVWTESNVNASAIRFPRSAIHGVADGAAIAGGYTPVVFVDEAVKIGIAQGGATKSGTFEITYRDDL